VDPFDTAAAWYDLLAGGLARIERESGLLRHALGPGRRVLDLACGTGLHARFFAELGASVVAADLSENMVGSAKSLRHHPGIQWVMGSMLAPPVNTVDLVTCLGNSIALLESPEDTEVFFRHAAGVLVPGGALMIQLLNGGGSVWRTDRTREVYATLKGMPITIRKRWNFLQATDTALMLTLTIEQINAFSALPAERIESQLRLWYPDFLETVAGASCFVLESRWGGITRVPYDPATSPDYVGIWRKEGR